MAEERGRRPGSPQTREQILEAAISSFVAHGYAQTTIRGVARAAGVDPALVMHFFGSKDGLFHAAIKGSMPVSLLAQAIKGDPGRLGERLVTRYLGLWEDPAHGPRMISVIRAAFTTPTAADLLKQLMSAELVEPVVERLGGDHAEVRALLAASQLLGMAMVRYILEVEPIASLPASRVAAELAPTVQRYLTGTLSIDELTGSRR
jgi:AcrR family transcriptional regulator